MDKVLNLTDLNINTELSKFEFDAIKKHYNSGGISYNPKEQIVTLYSIDETIGVEITKEIIESLARDLEETKQKEVIRISIINLSTSLTTKVKELMTFKNITLDQEERYKIKRDAAVRDDITAFELEGSIIGKDPVDLMMYVKQLTIEWENTNNTFLLKIDAIRVKLNSILSDGKYEYLEYVINYFNSNLELVLNNENILLLLSTLETEYNTSQEELLKDLEDEVEEVIILSEDNQNILSSITNETTVVEETTTVTTEENNETMVDEELDYGNDINP